MPVLTKYFLLSGFAENLRARRGWRRATAAFAFGLISALAFAPPNFFPVLWVSFPALIFLLQGTSGARAAFVTGWSFAFGSFLLGLYWIAASMFVDIGQFWWAVPLSVAGLPAFFALYYGLAAALAVRLGLKGATGAIIFALLWFLADYTRGHLFTGFPWNLEGYAWMKVLPMLQITSVTGIYGLTLLTLVAACVPVCLIECKKSCCTAVGASLFVLAAIGGWGMTRLMQSPTASSGVELRVVQPNIDQAHKWISSERDAHFQRLLDLTSAPGKTPPVYIVWPETASTFYLAEDAVHRRAIAAAMPPGAYLLTGVIRHDTDTEGKTQYYNSLMAMDSRARIAAVYDKFHLVPFGEYIPFRYILPIRTLVGLGVDFNAGDGVHTLHVDGLPSFSPLVCYEAIFPGEVADRGDRPRFLVNVTNDGWYARTAGPYQHFASARVRAIEEGLPLVRSANTGISGVVDAYGRVKAKIELGTTGFTDAVLPQALPPTIFSLYGEKPFWCLFILLACGAGFARWRMKPCKE